MWLGAALGLLGAGFGIFQGLQRSWQQQSDIATQQEQERRMREAEIAEQKARANREIEYAKSAFEIERQDAFRKADDIWHQGERIDMRADLDETLTGRAFNLAIKKNNAEDEQLLHQQQRGKQNFVNQQGGMQAALGMSGARGGANSAEQLLTQNEENFNQDLELMNRQRETQKDINLMQAFSSLKGGMFRIDEERDQANKAFRDSKQLRDDYTGDVVDEDITEKIEAIRKEYAARKDNDVKEHIRKYATFGFKDVDGIIARLEAEEAQKIKALQDAHRGGAGGRAVRLFNQKLYNRRADLTGSIDLQNLGGSFKQAAMQRAYDRAGYTVFDGLGDAFKGFSSGFNFGSSIAGFNKNWGGGGAGGGLGQAMMSAGQAGSGLFGSANKYKNPFGSPF